MEQTLGVWEAGGETVVVCGDGELCPWGCGSREGLGGHFIASKLLRS